MIELEQCQNCRGYIDEEDLFCANCGTEAPGHQAGVAPTDTAHHTFECKNCAAQMSYDAEAQALRCPYCDATELEKKPPTPSIAARVGIPFAFARDRATGILREQLARGWFRPSDLSKSARIDKLAAIYVPYWMFRARTKTYWTADSSRTPPGARGDWVPLFGEHRDEHNGLLVPASGALTLEETAALGRFDLAAGVPPQTLPTEGTLSEQFSVPRKYARPIARRSIEATEAATCEARYVPGSCRNMKVNVVVDGMQSEPVRLPVWVAAYRYREKTYRFLINGQTGLAHGDAPTSLWKVLLVVLLAAAAVALLGWALASG